MIRELEQKEFREMNAWSYSRLSLFAKDRMLYKKKYVDNEHISIPKTRAMIMGNLVDTLISAPESFEKLFIMRPFTIPKPQMKNYVEYLVEAYTNPSVLGEETAEEYAYRKEGIKGATLGKIKERFETEGREYYEIMLESLEKDIVTPQEYQKAQYVLQCLKDNPITAPILLHDKQKMYYSEYLGGCKFCPDFVDTERKVVTDLKMVTNSITDFQNNIKMFNYDIQAALFGTGIGIKEENYNTIDGDFFQFLVVNASYPEYPMLWRVSKEDFIAGKERVENLAYEAKMREDTNNWYYPLEGSIVETKLYEQHNR
jgi:hypothetical protein